MKLKKFLLILFLSITFLIGCNNSSSKKVEDSTPASSNVKSEKSNSYYSFFRNEKVSKENNDNLPFMVIVENSPSARPQSGLSDADIIYETSAEGGIPRFIALFQQVYPETIGPVRSVRPYFIDIAESFNVPFAHCGGSEDALNEIATSSSLMSINEIQKGNYFWRSSDRKAPHNLYTSSSNILKYVNTNNLKYDFNTILEFNNDYFSSKKLDSASKITIHVNNTYSTSYELVDNSYVKYMDNVKSIDANNNQPLSFTNIVIQQTNIDLSSDNLHLNVNLIGSGTGYVISNGKYIPVTWSKSSKDNKTKLIDSNGNTVYLSPGKTIWNIIDNSSKITFE